MALNKKQEMLLSITGMAVGSLAIIFFFKIAYDENFRRDWNHVFYPLLFFSLPVAIFVILLFKSFRD